MMYKMLIVDDDFIVRMDLRTLADWESLGVELLDGASNGVEALEKIHEYSPDIIILDLGMPRMDGLEVISRLKESKYEGKIIVLSCHDDFESVKEALKMGAVDYILKHMLKPESMVSSVKSAIESIEKENAYREEKKRFRQISEQSRTVLKDNLVKELIKGYWKDKDEIRAKFHQIGVKIQFSRFAVILVEVDELHELKIQYGEERFNSMLKALGKIIDDVVSNKADCINSCIDEGKFCIIMDFDKARSYMHINSEIYDVCSKTQQNAKNYLGICLSAGISRIFTDISSVSDSYTQARIALDGKMYMGKNKIIHFSEIEEFKNKPENILEDFEQEIYQIIASNEEAIVKYVKKIFYRIKSQNTKTEFIRFIGFELLSLAGRIVRNFRIGYEEVFGCEYLPYNSIMKFETIDEMEKWFCSICLKISSTLMQKDCKDISLLRPEVKKALEYIEKNYAKEITLQEIADYSNLSRTYFSQIFKQEMNENLTEYLNKYRIEKAKLLLYNSDAKIYEVGLVCGFDNYRYFTRLFKKITNLSPGEYREKVKDST